MFNSLFRISISLTIAVLVLVSVGCNNSPKGAVAPAQFADFPGEDTSAGSAGAKPKPKTQIDKKETLSED